MERQRNNQRIDVRDYCGSEYLAVADIDAPMVVTIEEVFVASFERGKDKVTLRFRELRKALPLNTENSTRLAQLFNTPYADEWRGQIGLYVDSNVKNAQGQRVGGIRVTEADKIQPQRVNGLAGHESRAAETQYSDEEFMDF